MTTRRRLCAARCMVMGVVAAAAAAAPGRAADQTPSLRDFPPKPAIRQPRTTARTDARTEAPRVPPAAKGAAEPAAPPPAPRGLGVENVIAEGWGQSEEDALRDAFRAAIRQVIGATVSSRTVVEQDRLVIDRIVSYSDGFIDSYKILDTAYESGHVHRRILATVKKRDLGRHVLAELSSSSQDGRGLWPEVVTKIERRKSALALLHAILEGYPWNCVEVAIEGRPAILGDRDGAARLGPKLVARVDADRFRSVEERLRTALEGLAVASGTVSTKATRASGPPLAVLENIFRSSFLTAPTPAPLEAARVALGTIFVFGQAEGWPPRKLASVADKSGFLVIVGNGRRWTWYLIQEKLELPRSPKVAWIDFRDAAARTVTKRGVGLGPKLPGISVGESTVDGKKLTTVFLSPFFLDHAADGYAINMLAGCANVSVSGEVAIPVDALSGITSIEARFDE